MSIEEVLDEAKAFMLSRRKASWQTYDYFKKRVAWTDSKRYEEFAEKLIKILKL